jgi:hypothetical protein
LLGAVAYLTEYKQDWKSKSWPTTTGRIVASNATPPVGDEGWSLDVSYEYQVGNSLYTSRRVSFGWLWRDVEPAEFAEEYPPGTELTVFYDPGNPATAVLFPRAGIEGFLGTIGGFMILALLTGSICLVGAMVWRALRGRS